MTLANAGTARATFTAPASETVLHFTVTATGVSGQVDTSTTTVTVQPVPLDPPTANAGPNQSVARGTRVTLAGSGTGASSYRWTQTAGDPVGPLPDVAAPSFTYPLFSAARGSTNTPLAFTLTVTGPTGTATSTVQVSPRRRHHVGDGTVPHPRPVDHQRHRLTVLGGADRHHPQRFDAGRSGPGHRRGEHR